jgi:hypothetical protein
VLLKWKQGVGAGSSKVSNIRFRGFRLTQHLLLKPDLVHATGCKQPSLKFIYMIIFSWPPLWSSGQSSWLQILGPGSILCATRFSEKYWAWNGIHSASWVQLISYLKEKVLAPVYKNRSYSRKGSAALTTRNLSILRSWH